MASLSLTSPLCTWLVAACMSVTCQKDQSQSSILRSSPSSSSSSKRLDRWARTRRRALLSRCGGDGGGDGSNSNRNEGLILSFCGSNIHGLMASCLAFEPCDEYYSAKNSSLFGKNGRFSSLFGSKDVPFNNNCKQRRLNRAAGHSGEAMVVVVQPTREIGMKKKPHTNKRRVVVTGMRVVTLLGHDPNVFYDNLLEGASGISGIETFDCAQFSSVSHF